MDKINYIIQQQNKILLQRIADDFIDDEDKEDFIKKYDKPLLKYIPIIKRDYINSYKAKINSKYLR